MNAPPTRAGRRGLARLGPLAYLGALALSALSILGLARALLTLAFLERARLEPELARAFWLGLRMDLLVTSYVLVPPTLALLLLPSAVVARLRRPLIQYFVVCVSLLASLEAISGDFIAQYDARPNRLFVEYLGTSREVLATVGDQYGGHVLLVVGATLAVAFVAARVARRALATERAWSAKCRLALLPACAPLLLLGMRGTLQHRPINAASAAFSSQNLVNQLALNSTYTAARAWYDLRHERSPADVYGKMAEGEVLTRVARYTSFPDTAQASVPFLHVQTPRAARARPLNLVIVLEESVGAGFVGCLGGLPLTPCFDALAREGLLLTDLYCTGTRTVRGIEAVVSGFLPTPGSSVVKLGKSQTRFFTVAALLREHGYATDFVYGGESHFDNMAAFFLGNGFERAFDESDYPHPAFRGTWGVSDEDLMRKANEVFVAHGDRPFFALILTTSNHSPFEFPAGRIELHDREPATRNNSVKYADHALGELFRLARRENYWKDTLWIVVADHDERTHGDGLIPVHKFHVPGLFLGPGVAPGRYAKVASQIDLVPTALGLMGLETRHPMIGRDLLALAANDPGRAVLQFNDVHGFLVGDRLAVHPGGAAPRCFRVGGGTLTPVEDDAELVRDARAHALLPGILYESRRYRLPEPLRTGG